MGKPRKAIVIDKKHGTTSVRSDRGSISVFSTERSNPPSYTQGSEPGSFVSSSRGGGPPSASRSSTFASGVLTGGARSYTSSSHGFVTLLKKKGAKCCLCATLHIVGTIEVKEPDFFWWNSKDDRKVHSRRNISFCEEHDSVVQEMIEAYRWGETIPILCTKVPGITFHLYRTSSTSQPPSKSDQRPRPHSGPSGFTSQSPQSPQSSRQHTKHASTHPEEPSRSYRDLPEPSERSYSESSASSDEEEDQLLWPADSTGYRPPGVRKQRYARSGSPPQDAEGNHLRHSSPPIDISSINLNDDDQTSSGDDHTGYSYPRNPFSDARPKVGASNETSLEVDDFIFKRTVKDICALCDRKAIGKPFSPKGLSQDDKARYHWWIAPKSSSNGFQTEPYAKVWACEFHVKDIANQHKQAYDTGGNPLGLEGRYKHYKANLYIYPSDRD